MMSCFNQFSSKCIWMDTLSDENQYVDFLRPFHLREIPAQTKLYICADTEYVVYVNGNFVGFDQYDGYPEHKAYDVYDVTAYLHVGENRLCIAAYYQGRNSMQYVRGIPMVVYALTADDLLIVSDGDTLCRASKGYRSGTDVELFTMQISYAFQYDARQSEQWTGLEYDYLGADWKKAVILPNMGDTSEFFERPVKRLSIEPETEVQLISQGKVYPAELNTRPLGLRMQKDFLSFCEADSLFSAGCIHTPYIKRAQKLPGELKLRDCSDVYLIFDLGEEKAGLFSMELTASEGTIVEVCYGEHLHDMRVRSFIGDRNFAFSYICKEGYQRFIHYFKRLGARYLQVCIRNQNVPTSIGYVGICSTSYPIKLRGNFSSADQLTNRILLSCDKTLRLCMHEHYEDSPWREQGLYAMDSRNQMLCGYYMYDNDEFALAGLRLLAEHPRADGFLQNASPSLYPVTMPSFSLEWILSLRDYILYTGNTEGARSLFSSAARILEAVEQYYDGTLIKTPVDDTIWNFYEWIPGLDDLNGLVQKERSIPEYDAPLNALYCLSIKAMIQICRWLGLQENHYDRQYEKIKDKFYSMFWSEEEQALATHIDQGEKTYYNELTQAWALLADLIPEEKRFALCEKLKDEDGSLIPCMISYNIFKYEALLEESEEFGKWVFDDISETWGNMLLKGTTCFWESISGEDDFENAGSLCHGWSAIPAYFYYAYLLGIRPVEPGYRKYVFKPIKMGVDLKGSVNTPCGQFGIVVHNGNEVLTIEEKNK